MDGKDSEDSSSIPAALAVVEDSSEATNDSLSVVINSEETSREPATNGNETTNDQDTTTTDETQTNGAGESSSNGVAIVGEPETDDNAVADRDELEPSTKKIRLQETEQEETA